ncbi:MAG: LytTR family DNA-binding domain-containing protein [Turicibacter sp.]|nr:LytTR family DNA-binding domain-containing protein [Turicibacter sp.]
MIPVFICEDDPKQRKDIEKLVSDYVIIEDMDMEVIATDNPHYILEILETHPSRAGVYFLDISLSHEMNGITLASKIREIDNQGAIIFVTMRAELAYLTFVYKLEVMDFIIKERPVEMANRIRECLKLVYERSLRREKTYQQFYQVKVEGRIRMVPYEEIMFFETSTTPHMIILHLAEGQLEFRGLIKEVAADDSFFRCHKSAVVNLNNIKTIEIAKKQIELANGLVCPVSAKALKELRAISIHG